MADIRIQLEKELDELVAKQSWTYEDKDRFDTLLNSYPEDTIDDEIVVGSYEEAGWLIWEDAERG